MEINSFIIWARDKNNHYSNAFKLYTTINIIIITIVAIYNKGKVTYSISSIIYITSINNLIINK